MTLSSILVVIRSLLFNLFMRPVGAGWPLGVVDIFQHPRLTELAALTSVKQDLPESIDAEPAQALLPASISAEDALKNFSESSQQNLTLDNIQAILPATIGQVMRLHEPCNHFIHEIAGSVDPNQLEIACQGLVQRHEILWTIFQQHNSTWVQIVLKQLDLQLVRHEAQCKSLSVVKELCAADDIRIPPVNCSPVAQFRRIQTPPGKSQFADHHTQVQPVLSTDSIPYINRPCR